MGRYNDETEIAVFGRGGWTIRVSLAPDYDYRPGEDDQCYPRLSYLERGEEIDADAGDLGPFNGISQGDYYRVTGEDRAELERVTGIKREDIEELAAKLADGTISHNLLIVTAERAGHELGRDVLGGVDFDGSRWEESMSYARSAADEYGMVEEAISEAEQMREALV